jgi:hypothetical protein
MQLVLSQSKKYFNDQMFSGIIVVSYSRHLVYVNDEAGNISTPHSQWQ